MVKYTAVAVAAVAAVLGAQTLVGGAGVASAQPAPGEMWTAAPRIVCVATAHDVAEIIQPGGASMYPWSGANLAVTRTPITDLKAGDFVVAEHDGRRIHHAVWTTGAFPDGRPFAVTIAWSGVRWVDSIRLVTQDNYIGKTEVLWKR